MNKLIELLNKYTTTSLEWIKDAHGKDQKVIDPMDYYKIEKEFLQSHPEPERKTAEEILEKITGKTSQYLKMNFVKFDDSIKAIHEYAMQYIELSSDEICLSCGTHLAEMGLGRKICPNLECDD